MKKADKVKLEREIGTKATELAKLLRKGADASDGKDYAWLQIDRLTGGSVVVHAMALPPGKAIMCVADEDEE